MYKQKIGISLGKSHEILAEQALPIIKKVGFDAVSPLWESKDELAETVALANELGLEIQSLHAPFRGSAALWSNDEKVSAPAKEEIFEAILACEKHGIPIIVLHTWIGFDYKFEKKSLNYDSFEKIVEFAKAHGVKTAFENTEGIEYLTALMEHFRDDESVGFCWDSGHEMCYNYSEDLLEKWGSRLIMTHLNDNLGVSDFGGRIYWTDDLHLLPYDGVADWDYNVARLKKAKHLPILNFELNLASKPDRHENDAYSKMTYTEYFTEAYKRACKIAYKYSF